MRPYWQVECSCGFRKQAVVKGHTRIYASEHLSMCSETTEHKLIVTKWEGCNKLSSHGIKAKEDV